MSDSTGAAEAYVRERLEEWDAVGPDVDDVQAAFDAGLRHGLRMTERGTRLARDLIRYPAVLIFEVPVSGREVEKVCREGVVGISSASPWLVNHASRIDVARRDDHDEIVIEPLKSR